MYKVCFFVPENEAEKVKAAMFKAGGGAMDGYTQCCFETKGVGQFMPQAGANPAIGSVGVLEKVVELKVEMLCSPMHIKEVIKAMKEAHPYEVPAFDIFKMDDVWYMV